MHRRILWGLFTAALALPPAVCLLGGFAWAFHLLGDSFMRQALVYTATLVGGVWLLALTALVLVQTAAALASPWPGEPAVK